VSKHASLRSKDHRPYDKLTLESGPTGCVNARPTRPPSALAAQSAAEGPMPSFKSTSSKGARSLLRARKESGCLISAKRHLEPQGRPRTVVEACAAYTCLKERQHPDHRPILVQKKPKPLLTGPCAVDLFLSLVDRLASEFTWSKHNLGFGLFATAPPDVLGMLAFLQAVLMSCATRSTPGSSSAVFSGLISGLRSPGNLLARSFGAPSPLEGDRRFHVVPFKQLGRPRPMAGRSVR